MLLELETQDNIFGISEPGSMEGGGRGGEIHVFSIYIYVYILCQHIIDLDFLVRKNVGTDFNLLNSFKMVLFDNIF